MAQTAAEQVQELDDSDVEEVEPQPEFRVDIEDELRDEGTSGSVEPDPQLLPREAQAFPPLHPPLDPKHSGARAKAAIKIRQENEKEAAAAMASGDVVKAIDKYTEAMRTGGATAMMLATRGALLLKQKRPCAAIRDCSAALKLNVSIVRAYRIRGIAHRQMGHWFKAQRDLSEAQALKFDAETADMLKFVNTQCSKHDAPAWKKTQEVPKQGVEARKPWVEPVLDPTLPVAAAVAAHPELEKGLPVTICGLQKVPHLNGKRGIVERCDPRPAARGRWEIEVRLDGGTVAIKSLKRENILTLNKADKVACREWMAQEKQHREERLQREEREEQAKYRQCVEAKMGKMQISQDARDLLRQLLPKDALGILDEAEKPGVVSVNEFLLAEAERHLEQGPAAKRPRNS